LVSVLFVCPCKRLLGGLLHFRFFRDQRNYFLAHYDGTQADYHEPNEHMTSMKMVGVNLNSSQRDKLEALVIEMLRWLECRLYPARRTGE
jgi:hypothetical protein